MQWGLAQPSADCREVIPFWQAERSSFPARNEQPREIVQLWANLNCFQAAPSHQHSPASLSPLSPVLGPPGAAALPSGSSSALKATCCLPWRGQFYYQPPYQEGIHSLSRQSHNRLGWGSHRTLAQHSALLPPIVPTSSSHCFPPQHSHAEQTAAPYYSVVA